MKTRQMIFGLALMMLISAANAQTSEQTNITVNGGNAVPYCLVSSLEAQNPTQNGATVVPCFFMAYDPNIKDDLNLSTADCFFMKSGETQRNKSACTSLDSGDHYNVTCNVSMQYYDAPGPWKMNCSISDNSAALGYNDTQTFTYNTLTAIDLSPTGINFGSLVMGQTAGATNDPLVVYNQGNSNITNMTITAYDLQGGASTMSAGSFNVSNIDSSGTGANMANDTAKQVPDASADRGAGSSEDLYMWVTVPGGLSPVAYSSTQSWVVGAFT